MKPAPFEYVVPESLDAAADIMQEHGYDAKLLAGGQSLVPMMNFRLVQPELLVDLNRVPGLEAVRQDDSGELRLGSMVRQSRLANDPLVAELAPLVHETVPFIAHPQIRNRGTLGGTLVHADPAAELPAVMVALEARFRLRSSAGERWVEAEEFFLGLFVTSCEPEEILVEVVIPNLSTATGHAFEEVARRHGDFALAGVAALLTLDESGMCSGARLVFLSAGEIPIIARSAGALMLGERPSESLFDAAAEAAARQDISPVGDIHATAEFKRHLAAVMTKRALRKAVAKAEAAA
jgi:carbon-monoxide dehydrogenase medium subunit